MVNARSINRLPEPNRWTAGVLAQMQATPWSQREVTAPEVAFHEPAGPPEAATATAEAAAPMRFRINAADLAVHGCSGGCPDCLHIQWFGEVTLGGKARRRAGHDWSKPLAILQMARRDLEITSHASTATLPTGSGRQIPACEEDAFHTNMDDGNFYNGIVHIAPAAVTEQRARACSIQQWLVGSPHQRQRRRRQARHRHGQRGRCNPGG